MGIRPPEDFDIEALAKQVKKMHENNMYAIAWTGGFLTIAFVFGTLIPSKGCQTRLKDSSFLCGEACQPRGMLKFDRDSVCTCAESLPGLPDAGFGADALP